MVVTAPVQVAEVRADREVESEPGMMMMMKMTLTNAGRQGVGMHHQSQWWLARSHARRAQVTPRLTESCQSSTSLGPKERTMLGHRILDWTDEQKREDTRGEDAGETSKTPPVQSRDCGSTRHPPLPEDYGASDTQAAFPEVGEGDRPGLQDRSAVPVSGDTVSPRSGGGIPCQVV